MQGSPDNQLAVKSWGTALQVFSFNKRFSLPKGHGLRKKGVDRLQLFSECVAKVPFLREKTKPFSTFRVKTAKPYMNSLLLCTSKHYIVVE